MLIITRRPGESFFIGDEIEVVILEGGSKVRVGISAPKDIEITRTELIPESELTTTTTQ
jgi:carbon storage regulator CsrA